MTNKKHKDIGKRVKGYFGQSSQEGVLLHVNQDSDSYPYHIQISGRSCFWASSYEVVEGHVVVTDQNK